MIMEEPLLIYKKKEIRKKMLALRRALSTDETDKMAMCLRANIVSLPQYTKANRIMAFLAMRGESNLDPLIEQAVADEKEIYIPVCLPERQMGGRAAFFHVRLYKRISWIKESSCTLYNDCTRRFRFSACSCGCLWSRWNPFGDGSRIL